MEILALVEFIDDATLEPARALAARLGWKLHRPSLSLPPDQRKALGLELIERAEVLLAGRFGEEHLQRAARLRWIHSPAAGVNHLLTPTLLKSDIVLTNGAGTNSIPIAEHVLGMMLSFNRRLRPAYEAQQARRWEFQEGNELYGQTLGIVGYGRIGRELARRARAFGMTVWATKRSLDRPEIAPDPDLDLALPPAQLPRLLQAADFVVLAAALTPETEGLFGLPEFEAMKRSACLINIARGGLVQEDALLAALQAGTIAGAGLDVVVQEPLPADSPLWQAPNLLLTAHSSWTSPQVRRRNVALFCDNLERFAGGQPLLNVVDKARGY